MDSYSFLSLKQIRQVFTEHVQRALSSLDSIRSVESSPKTNNVNRILTPAEKEVVLFPL